MPQKKQELWQLIEEIQNREARLKAGVNHVSIVDARKLLLRVMGTRGMLSSLRRSAKTLHPMALYSFVNHTAVLSFKDRPLKEMIQLFAQYGESGGDLFILGDLRFAGLHRLWVAAGWTRPFLPGEFPLTNSPLDDEFRKLGFERGVPPQRSSKSVHIGMKEGAVPAIAQELKMPELLSRIDDIKDIGVRSQGAELIKAIKFGKIETIRMFAPEGFPVDRVADMTEDELRALYKEMIETYKPIAKQVGPRAVSFNGGAPTFNLGAGVPESLSDGEILRGQPPVFRPDWLPGETIKTAEQRLAAKQPVLLANAQEIWEHMWQNNARIATALDAQGQFFYVRDLFIDNYSWSSHANIDTYQGERIQRPLVFHLSGDGFLGVNGNNRLLHAAGWTKPFKPGEYPAFKGMKFSPDFYKWKQRMRRLGHTVKAVYPDAAPRRISLWFRKGATAKTQKQLGMLPSKFERIPDADVPSPKGGEGAEFDAKASKGTHRNQVSRKGAAPADFPKGEWRKTLTNNELAELLKRLALAEESGFSLNRAFVPGNGNMLIDDDIAKIWPELANEIKSRQDGNTPKWLLPEDDKLAQKGLSLLHDPKPISGDGRTGPDGRSSDVSPRDTNHPRGIDGGDLEGNNGPKAQLKGADNGPSTAVLDEPMKQPPVKPTPPGTNSRGTVGLDGRIDMGGDNSRPRTSTTSKEPKSISGGGDLVPHDGVANPPNTPADGGGNNGHNPKAPGGFDGGDFGKRRLSKAEYEAMLQRLSGQLNDADRALLKWAQEFEYWGAAPHVAKGGYTPPGSKSPEFYKKYFPEWHELMGKRAEAYRLLDRVDDPALRSMLEFLFNKTPTKIHTSLPSSIADVLRLVDKIELALSSNWNNLLAVLDEVPWYSTGKTEMSMANLMHIMQNEGKWMNLNARGNLPWDESMFKVWVPNYTYEVGNNMRNLRHIAEMGLEEFIRFEIIAEGPEFFSDYNYARKAEQQLRHILRPFDLQWGQFGNLLIRGYDLGIISVEEVQAARQWAKHILEEAERLANEFGPTAKLDGSPHWPGGPKEKAIDIQDRLDKVQDFVDATTPEALKKGSRSRKMTARARNLVGQFWKAVSKLERVSNGTNVVAIKRLLDAMLEQYKQNLIIFQGNQAKSMEHALTKFRMRVGKTEKIIDILSELKKDKPTAVALLNTVSEMLDGGVGKVVDNTAMVSRHVRKIAENIPQSMDSFLHKTYLKRLVEWASKVTPDELPYASEKARKAIEFLQKHANDLDFIAKHTSLPKTYVNWSQAFIELRIMERLADASADKFGELKALEHLVTQTDAGTPVSTKPKFKASERGHVILSSWQKRTRLMDKGLSVAAEGTSDMGNFATKYSLKANARRVIAATGWGTLILDLAFLDSVSSVQKVDLTRDLLVQSPETLKWLYEQRYALEAKYPITEYLLDDDGIAEAFAESFVSPQHKIEVLSRLDAEEKKYRKWLREIDAAIYKKIKTANGRKMLNVELMEHKNILNGRTMLTDVISDGDDKKSWWDYHTSGHKRDDIAAALKQLDWTRKQIKGMSPNVARQIMQYIRNNPDYFKYIWSKLGAQEKRLMNREFGGSVFDQYGRPKSGILSHQPPANKRLFEEFFGAPSQYSGKRLAQMLETITKLAESENAQQPVSLSAEEMRDLYLKRYPIIREWVVQKFADEATAKLWERALILLAEIVVGVASGSIFFTGISVLAEGYQTMQAYEKWADANEQLTPNEIWKHEPSTSVLDPHTSRGLSNFWNREGRFKDRPRHLDKNAVEEYFNLKKPGFLTNSGWEYYVSGDKNTVYMNFNTLKVSGDIHRLQSWMNAWGHNKATYKTKKGIRYAAFFDMRKQKLARILFSVWESGGKLENQHTDVLPAPLRNLKGQELARAAKEWLDDMWADEQAFKKIIKRETDRLGITHWFNVNLGERPTDHTHPLYLLLKNEFGMYQDHKTMSMEEFTKMHQAQQLKKLEEAKMKAVQQYLSNIQSGIASVVKNLQTEAQASINTDAFRNMSKQEQAMFLAQQQRIMMQKVKDAMQTMGIPADFMKKFIPQSEWAAWTAEKPQGPPNNNPRHGEAVTPNNIPIKEESVQNGKPQVPGGKDNAPTPEVVASMNATYGNGNRAKGGVQTVPKKELRDIKAAAAKGDVDSIRWLKENGQWNSAKSGPGKLEASNPETPHSVTKTTTHSAPKTAAPINPKIAADNALANWAKNSPDNLIDLNSSPGVVAYQFAGAKQDAVELIGLARRGDKGAQKSLAGLDKKHWEYIAPDKKETKGTATPSEKKRVKPTGPLNGELPKDHPDYQKEADAARKAYDDAIKDAAKAKVKPYEQLADFYKDHMSKELQMEGAALRNDIDAFNKKLNDEAANAKAAHEAAFIKEEEARRVVARNANARTYDTAESYQTGAEKYFGSQSPAGAAEIEGAQDQAIKGYDQAVDSDTTESMREAGKRFIEDLKSEQGNKDYKAAAEAKTDAANNTIKAQKEYDDAVKHKYPSSEIAAAKKALDKAKAEEAAKVAEHKAIGDKIRDNEERITDEVKAEREAATAEATGVVISEKDKAKQKKDAAKKKPNTVASNKAWANDNKRKVDKINDKLAAAQYKAANADTDKEKEDADKEVKALQGAMHTWQAAIHKVWNEEVKPAMDKASESSDYRDGQELGKDQGHGQTAQAADRHDQRQSGDWTAQEEKEYKENERQARDDQHAADEKYRDWYQRGGKDELDRQELENKRERYQSGPAHGKRDKKGNGHSYGCQCSSCGKEEEKADARAAAEEARKKQEAETKKAADAAAAATAAAKKAADEKKKEEELKKEAEELAKRIAEHEEELKKLIAYLKALFARIQDNLANGRAPGYGISGNGQVNKLVDAAAVDSNPEPEDPNDIPIPPGIIVNLIPWHMRPENQQKDSSQDDGIGAYQEPEIPADILVMWAVDFLEHRGNRASAETAYGDTVTEDGNDGDDSGTFNLIPLTPEEIEEMLEALPPVKPKLEEEEEPDPFAIPFDPQLLTPEEAEPLPEEEEPEPEPEPEPDDEDEGGTKGKYGISPEMQDWSMDQGIAKGIQTMPSNTAKNVSFPVPPSNIGGGLGVPPTISKDSASQPPTSKGVALGDSSFSGPDASKGVTK